MRAHKLPFAALLATFLLLYGIPSQAQDLKAAIQQMGGKPCGDLTCVTLDMPVNHHASSGLTVKIEYAISFAGEESKGVMVFLVGGPGQSGLALASEWLPYYDAKLQKNMDIVFFDQRGIGPDHGVSCPKAQTSFNMARPSIEKPDEAIAIAKSYATDCPAEFRSQALVKFLDTEQAIRDLEKFRETIGGPKIWIYGASYGTQFAQQYATAFPTSVKGVVIDGVVDLSLTYEQYEASYTLASERILTRVLEACDKIPGCGEDMKDADAVYATLAAKAAKQPIEVNFPKADGSFEKRALTLNMLKASANNSLLGPDQRAAFLRALAAASRDQLLPLLQLGYESLRIDPRTQEAVIDHTYYQAAYYAITCSEYGEGTPDRDATARKIIESAKAFSPNAPRLLELYYMERLVCAFWPERGPAARPKPYAGGGFPTLILSADADPVTPLSMSVSVFSQADNIFMTIVRGGPHVSWGYGDSCVDDPVYDLLIAEKTPKKQTYCDQPFIGDYARRTLVDGAGMDDARTVAVAVETEIDRSVELGRRDRKKDSTIVCDFGGTVTASKNKDGMEYVLADCAWWPRLSLNGKATKVSVKGSESVTLELAISGQHNGKIVYRRDIAGKSESLSGTYDGKDIAVR